MYYHLVNKPVRVQGYIPGTVRTIPRDVIYYRDRGPLSLKYLYIKDLSNFRPVIHYGWLNYTPNNSLVSTTENSR